MDQSWFCPVTIYWQQKKYRGGFKHPFIFQIAFKSWTEPWFITFFLADHNWHLTLSKQQQQKEGRDAYLWQLRTADRGDRIEQRLFELNSSEQVRRSASLFVLITFPGVFVELVRFCDATSHDCSCSHWARVKLACPTQIVLYQSALKKHWWFKGFHWEKNCPTCCLKLPLQPSGL